MSSRKSNQVDKALQPPWVVFKDGEQGQVMPACRPGSVTPMLPLDLADAICKAGNDWHWKQKMQKLAAIRDGLKEIRDLIEEDPDG